MKKYKFLFLATSFFLLVSGLKAQTPFTVAEDFLVKDTDAITHTLFPILDAGNIAVLTFFTTT